jgi:hypothetical protein
MIEFIKDLEQVNSGNYPSVQKEALINKLIEMYKSGFYDNNKV